ncbi:MAG TPA: hypothetical protein VMZ53_22600 [Kofleriaceae bacterium]|nr:hypothetical protein [Kofleriaceae bacterium]
MTTKLAAAVLLALTSTAAAQTYVARDVSYAEPPAPKAPRMVDARLGLMLGGSDVGDADGFSAGASGALGYRIGDVTLRGMFDYYKVGDGSDEALSRHGRATRVGGAVRYSFANTGYDSSAAVDFWGELGAGYEHVAWRHGGILERPSGELAVGLDLGRRGERNARGERKEIGYFMAFRSLVAHGPEMEGATAMCGGPCTEATKPPRTDVSMFFELGVHWGR